MCFCRLVDIWQTLTLVKVRVFLCLMTLSVNPRLERNVLYCLQEHLFKAVASSKELCVFRDHYYDVFTYIHKQYILNSSECFIVLYTWKRRVFPVLKYAAGPLIT